jgi:uncharacterized membrane protein
MTQDDINQSEYSDPANWSALTYNSRKDSRIFVPKRRGFGVTVNFGHKNGKIVFVALLALLLLVFGVAWISGYHLTGR